MKKPSTKPIPPKLEISASILPQANISLADADCDSHKKTNEANKEKEDKKEVNDLNMKGKGSLRGKAVDAKKASGSKKEFLGFL